MKIIVIWSPWSGKSEFTRSLKEVLNYPVMHLDKIYHISEKEHITREELIEKINKFANKYNDWIIDWNYMSTLDLRVKLSNTIILLNISSNICLNNVFKRTKSTKNWIARDDIVENFDETLTEDFINFIKNFKKNNKPKIIKILKNYSDKKVITRITKIKFS